MQVIKTEIDDILIIKNDIFQDEMGYFFESYNKKVFELNNIKNTFVQDNQSGSTFGVLRGLHYQLEPFAQTKLVRVLKGKVWDVAVDLRKDSPTFGKYVGIELSEENRVQLLIPKGFAHGFLVLSQYAEFFYKCDNFYNKEFERGIRFDDPDIGIKWPLSKEQLILSEKDKRLPFLKNAEITFRWSKEWIF